MDAKIQTHTVKQVIEVSTRLEVRQLEEDIFLIRRTTTPLERKNLREEGAMKPSKNTVLKTVWSGYVTGQGVEQIRAGENPDEKNILNLTVLSQQDQELFRTRGYQFAIDEMSGGKGWERQDPWKRWQADPEPGLDELVVMDFGNNMLFDRHGKHLPVALYFDYINNRIDESSHDLRAVYEHLKKRDDIRIMAGNSRDRKWEKEASCFEQALFDIPHYNCEEGRTQSIQFVWTPRLEDYRRVFGKKNTSGRHSLVLESDVLGLSACENTSQPTAKMKRGY